MEFKMTLLGSLLLFSMCLSVTFGDYNYGVAPVGYNPPYSPPSYNPPPYNPPSYNPPPVYYETEETNVDYREANNTRRCGVQPTVHRHGLPKDETTFGEYPWVVAVLDTYQVYKCSGVLITPRHVLTAGNCVSGLNANDIVVRVGDYDIQTDRNNLEVYKNYEIPVCKKHFYYSIPEYSESQPNQYGYASPPQQQYYKSDDVYDAIILELNEDVNMDAYPQVEPICLPEFYYRSKEYTKEYYQSYGQSVPSPDNDKIHVNKEGSSEDLECWVVGYSYSPSAEIKYQTETVTYTTQTYTVPAPPAPPSYGYNYAPPPYYPPQTYTKYVPAYSYETYKENSLTPRRAKVHKIDEEYQAPPPPPPPTYGYNPPPTYTSGAPEPKKDLYENWEADYSYDTCRADVGSAIMCRVPGRYTEEDNGKEYENYVPEYYNPPPPPPPPQYYSPPPVYSPPQTYQQPPAYSPPQPSYYQPSRTRREANYYTPAPAPQYQSYATPPPPEYQSYTPPPPPQYQSYAAPPPPAYSPPPPPASYSESNPINPAEDYNEEYRRFAVFGIVQYSTTCSSDSYESKKLQVTPVEDILPWILNVIHTPVSQCSKYQAPPPQTSYDYSTPDYSTPMYDYQPAVYAPQVYSPPPPPPTYSYNPPPPSYLPPAPPSYYY